MNLILIKIQFVFTARGKNFIMNNKNEEFSLYINKDRAKGILFSAIDKILMEVNIWKK